jgi:hypothetical protein
MKAQIRSRLVLRFCSNALGFGEMLWQHGFAAQRPGAGKGLLLIALAL